MRRYRLAVGANGRQVFLAGVAATNWWDSFSSRSIVIGIAWRAEVKRIAQELADADSIKQTAFFVEIPDQGGEYSEEVVSCIPGQKLNVFLMMEEGDITIIYITGARKLEYQVASPRLH